MRRRACAAAGLAAVLLFHPEGLFAGDTQNGLATLEGRYFADADSSGSMMIMPLTRATWPAYRVVAVQWEGVGHFDGTTYWGVFRGLAGARGTHLATLRPDGSLDVHGAYTSGRTGSFETVWRPENSATLVTFCDTLLEQHVGPRDFELPNALKKVAPVYPEIGGPGIEGTVLLQVLVGEDGLVKDTRVVKSIPLLNEAAEACVRQWVFKPARSKGKPLAIWVAVPVRFSSHGRTAPR